MQQWGTSGSHGICFEDGEEYIYWNIFDLSAGYPADSGLQSITKTGTEKQSLRDIFYNAASTSAP